MADFKLRGQVELSFSPKKGVSEIAAQIRRELGGSIPVNLAVKGDSSTAIDRIRSRAKELVKETENIGKGMSSSIQRNSSKSIEEYKKFITNVEKETKKLNKTVNLFDSFVGGVSTRFAQFAKFAIASAGVQKIVQAIDYGFDAIIKINSAQIKLQQITGNTAAEVNRFSASIIQLSRNVGVASTDLLEASDTLAQAGFGLKTVQSLMKSLANTQLVPTFGNLEKTTEGVVSAIAQFQLLDVNGSTRNVDKFLSTLNTLSKKYAVEAGNIIEAIKSAGGVFAASEGILGGDSLGLGTSANADKNLDKLREFASIVTSIRSTTRLSESVISTGLRTIINRLQDPSVEAKLKEILGADFSLRNTRGEFIGTLKAAENLNLALQDVGSNTRTFIEVANAIGGGVRQAKIAIPLITSVADSYKALAEARKGDNSLSKDAELAAESLSVKITKIGQDLAAFGVKVAESSGFKIMLDQIREVIKGVTFLLDTLSPALQVGVAMGLGNIIGPALYNMGRGTISTLSGAGPGALISRRDLGYVSATPALDKIKVRNPYYSSGTIDEVYGALANNRKGFAKGGYVNALLMPGEIVFSPEEVQQIGLSNLQKLNRQGLAGVDSVPAVLPHGSYVLNKNSAKQMSVGGSFIDNYETLLNNLGIQLTHSAPIKGRGEFEPYTHTISLVDGLKTKRSTGLHELVHGLGVDYDAYNLKDHDTIYNKYIRKYSKRMGWGVREGMPTQEIIAKLFQKTNYDASLEGAPTAIESSRLKLKSLFGVTEYVDPEDSEILSAIASRNVIRRVGFDLSNTDKLGLYIKNFEEELTSTTQGKNILKNRRLVQSILKKHLPGFSQGGEVDDIDLGYGVSMRKRLTTGGIKSPISFGEGREMINLVDDKGRDAWFYRSMAGTSGKQQGMWYPFGAIADMKNGSWIIKSDVINNPGMSRPGLDLLYLKANKLLPHSDEDMDKFINKYLNRKDGSAALHDESLQRLRAKFPNLEYGNHEHYRQLVQHWKDTKINPVWGPRVSKQTMNSPIAPWVRENRYIASQIPRRFANGGFVGTVPGSGNQDNFPTYLEDGSFVLNKKASNMLRARKLQKFAYGSKRGFFDKMKNLWKTARTTPSRTYRNPQPEPESVNENLRILAAMGVPVFSEEYGKERNKNKNWAAFATKQGAVGFRSKRYMNFRNTAHESVHALGIDDTMKQYGSLFQAERAEYAKRARVGINQVPIEEGATIFLESNKEYAKVLKSLTTKLSAPQIKAINNYHQSLDKNAQALRKNYQDLIKNGAPIEEQIKAIRKSIEAFNLIEEKTLKFAEKFDPNIRRNREIARAEGIRIIREEAERRRIQEFTQYDSPIGPQTPRDIAKRRARYQEFLSRPQSSFIPIGAEAESADLNIASATLKNVKATQAQQKKIQEINREININRAAQVKTTGLEPLTLKKLKKEEQELLKKRSEAIAPIKGQNFVTNADVSKAELNYARSRKRYDIKTGQFDVKDQLYQAENINARAMAVATAEEKKLRSIQSRLNPITFNANNQVVKGSGDEKLRKGIAQIIRANKNELDKLGIKSIKDFSEAVRKGTVSLEKMSGVSAQVKTYFQDLSKQTQQVINSQSIVAQTKAELDNARQAQAQKSQIIAGGFGTSGATKILSADTIEKAKKAKGEYRFIRPDGLTPVQAGNQKIKEFIFGEQVDPEIARNARIASQSLPRLSGKEREAALNDISSFEQAQARLDQKRFIRNQRVGTAGLAAGIVGSILASSENKTVAAGGNILANTGAGASIGVSFGGLPGAVVGGIAGGGLSLLSEISKNNKETKDAEKLQLAYNIEETINRGARYRNDPSVYRGLNRQISDFAKSGNTRFADQYGLYRGSPEVERSRRKTAYKNAGIAMSMMTGGLSNFFFDSEKRAEEDSYQAQAQRDKANRNRVEEYLSKTDEVLPKILEQTAPDRAKLAELSEKERRGSTQARYKLTSAETEQLKTLRQKLKPVQDLEFNSEFFSEIGEQGVSDFEAFTRDPKIKKMTVDQQIQEFTRRKQIQKKDGGFIQVQNQYADAADKVRKRQQDRERLVTKSFDIEDAYRRIEGENVDIASRRQDILPKIQAIRDTADYNTKSYLQAAEARKSGDLTSAGRATNIGMVLNNRLGYDAASRNKAQSQLEGVFGKDSRISRISRETSAVEDFGANFAANFSKQINTSGFTGDSADVASSMLNDFLKKSNLEGTDTGKNLRQKFDKVILSEAQGNLNSEEVIKSTLRTGDFQGLIDETISEGKNIVSQGAAASDELTNQRVGLLNQYSDAKLTARRNRFNPVRQAAEFQDQFAALSGASNADIAQRQVTLKRDEIRNLVGRPLGAENFTVQELKDRRTKLEERRNELDINNPNAQQEIANLTTEIKAVDEAMGILANNTADASAALAIFEEKARKRDVDRKNALGFVLGSDQEREGIVKRQKALEALQTGNINYNNLTEEERGSLSAAIENERQRDPKRAAELEKQILLGASNQRGNLALQQFQAGGDISGLTDQDRGEIKKRLEEQLATAESTGDGRAARKARRALGKFDKATERLGVDVGGYTDFNNNKIEELAQTPGEFAENAPEKAQLEKALQTNAEAANYFNDQDKQVITDISNAFNSLNENISKLGEIDFGSINFDPALQAAQTFEKAANLLASAQVNIQGNVTVTGAVSGGGGGANDAVLASVQSVVDKALSDFATANNMNYSKLS